MEFKWNPCAFFQTNIIIYDFLNNCIYVAHLSGVSSKEKGKLPWVTKYYIVKLQTECAPVLFDIKY